MKIMKIDWLKIGVISIGALVLILLILKLINIL